MTASAHDAEREDFASSLSRFAHGLSIGGAGRRADGSQFLPRDAVSEALAACAATPRAQDARAAAYRVLVRRFLDAVDAAPDRPPQSAEPGVWHGSAAVRARPAAETVRTRDALRGLAPVERAALLLVAVERFSYAQAADFMEIGEAEFVQALARAREAFAARLAAATGRPHLRLVE